MEDIERQMYVNEIKFLRQELDRTISQYRETLQMLAKAISRNRMVKQQ